MSENVKAVQNSFIARLGLDNLIETSGKILTGRLSKADVETLSIVFNTDQFQMLMKSMEEVRNGEIVSFREAFEDLN